MMHWTQYIFHPLPQYNDVNEKLYLCFKSICDIKQKWKVFTSISYYVKEEDAQKYLTLSAFQSTC